MNKILTLNLNHETIEIAKKCASNNGMSLSQLIENYLKSLTTEKLLNNNLEISLYIKNISSSIHISVDYDYKKDRADFLQNKHR